MKTTTKLTRHNLHGIWAALITPWDDAFNLREDRLRQEVALYAKDGVNGFYTGGTTGEFYAQDDTTYARITEVVCEAARAANIPVQIGCTALSNRTVGERIRIARDHGADALQLAIPFWLELKDDEVLNFFSGSVRAAGDTPLVAYDTGRAKRKLGAKLTGRLAAEFPTFIGMKDSGCSPEELRSTLAEAPDLSIFSGEDDLLPKMRAGGKGCYSSWCGLNAHLVRNLYDLCAAGQWEEAEPVQRSVAGLLDGILPLLNEGGLLDSAVDRALRILGGSDVGLRCAEPYRSMTPNQLEDLRRWIHQSGPAWLS